MQTAQGMLLTGTGDPADLAFGAFQVRLSWIAANEIDVVPVQGYRVQIGRQLVQVESGEFDVVLDNSDTTIDASGIDTTSIPAASTLHYAYLSNALATDAPLEIRLSETAPSLLDGVYYLGTSGNAQNWRFAGWVYVNASQEFTDHETARHVVNYYHRVPKRLFTCPEYADDNADTTYAINLAAFAPINGGTGDSLTWISTGEDATELSAHLRLSAASGTAVMVGPGFDSSADPAVTAALRSIGQTATAVEARTLATGLRTGYLLCCTQTTANTVLADHARFGAAADPAATYLVGWCMG